MLYKTFKKEKGNIGNQSPRGLLHDPIISTPW
jgi:hypothetical protein